MLTNLRWVIPMVLCFAVAAFGGKKSNLERTVKKERPAMVHEEDIKDAPRVRGEAPIPPMSAPPVGVYTGNGGWWDFQSNGGSTRYFEKDSATGLMHAIIMTCTDSSAAGQSPSRRTVYAMSTDNGATWLTFGGVQVPDLIRSGYPSLDFFKSGPGAGKPVIANHNDNDASGLKTWAYYGEITPPSTATFIQTTTPVDPRPGPGATADMIWPMILGPADGSVTVMPGWSIDPGDTNNWNTNAVAKTTDFVLWSPWTVFPAGRLSARGAGATSKGGKVGYMASGVYDTLYFWESTNNGTSWPATADIIYPANRYVGAESLTTTWWWDVTYDGETPLFAMSTTRLNVGAGTLNIGQSRIEFRSGKTGPFVYAVKPDTLLYAQGTSGHTSHRFPTASPSICKTGSTIVIAYCAFLNNTETLDTVSGYLCGEIYVVQSTTGGATWSSPKNITKTPKVDERYPCVSRYNEPGFVNLVWLEDARGGFHIPTIIEAPTSYSRQVYHKIDLSTIFVANDMQALSIDAPTAGYGYKVGESFTPKATFRNVGLATQSSVNVKYQVFNSSLVEVYTNTKTIATIVADEDVQVTFDDVSTTGWPIGLYTTKATSLLGGDADPSSDVTSSNINLIPVVTVTGTYHEDFEDPGPESGGFGWYTALVAGYGSGFSDWVIGTPAKAQLTHAHSGTKCWVTKTTGNYSNGKISFVGSPSFDLSSYPVGNVALEFWQNFVWESHWDGGVVQYSTDGGITWEVADHTLGSGPSFNTPASKGWYNAADDTGGVSNGVYTPPYWSDSTSLYAGNSDRWIRSSTLIPVGNQSDVRLRWVMEADESVVREGWAVDDITIGPASSTVGVSITTGWNMISNPVTAASEAVLDLYPTSQFSYVFRFDPVGGYQQTTTMANGPGFWGKFSSGGTTNITGGRRYSDQLLVSAGWNMVGTVSDAVDTSSITSTPAGIRASDWFGFSGSYTAATTLVPGKAYWVKASAPGAFYISSVAPPSANTQPAHSIADQFNSITIRDAKGSSQTLYFGVDQSGQMNVAAYELPPVPPSGAFDIRFDSKDGGVMLKTHASSDATVQLPISIQATSYPLEVTWNTSRGERRYVLTDAFGGIAVAPKSMGSTGSVKITNSAINKLVIRAASGSEIPAEYALLQNFPNPFNPSTNVKFALPLDSRVNVQIFNILGQQVRTLVSGDFEAGYHVVEWNGRNDAGQQLSSGVYLLKISAANSQGRSFSDVQKLMMLK